MDLFSYLLGKKSGGTVNLQSKEVTIEENTTTNITPDEGYDGLSDVQVTTNIDYVGDYYRINPTSLGQQWLKNSYFIKFPDIIIPETATNIYRLYYNWVEETTPKVIFGNHITSLYQAGYYCKSKTIDTSGWNTTNIGDMGETFIGCTSLTSIDLSNVSPANAIETYGTFKNCSALKTVDLSNLENVTSIREMFYNCRQLTTLDVRKMIFTNLTTSAIRENAFTSVPASCLIIVKDNEQKAWFSTYFSNLTNVKTVAEL